MGVTQQCRAVANFIIEETNKFNDEKKITEKVIMTIMRLQKLLYFCDVEYMKINNGISLFEDQYYAWPSGPVIEEIYYEFSLHRDCVMRPNYEKQQIVLTQDIKSIIKKILEETKDLDTMDLVKIVNIEGGPHNQVFKEEDKNHEQIISKKEMYNYYYNKNFFSETENLIQEVSNKKLRTKKLLKK